jgi:hypothetical protein
MAIVFKSAERARYKCGKINVHQQIGKISEGVKFIDGLEDQLTPQETIHLSKAVENLTDLPLIGVSTIMAERSLLDTSKMWNSRNRRPLLMVIDHEVYCPTLIQTFGIRHWNTQRLCRFLYPP